MRVYSLGISPVFIRTKIETMGRQGSWSRRRQDQVLRALRVAWHKSLKHGDVNYDWNRFCFLTEVCGVSVIAALSLRASLFSLSLQLSTTATFVLPVLLRSRPSL